MMFKGILAISIHSHQEYCSVLCTILALLFYLYIFGGSSKEV